MGECGRMRECMLFMGQERRGDKDGGGAGGGDGEHDFK